MVCREVDSLTYGWDFIDFHTFLNESLSIAVELVSNNDSNNAIHQMKIVSICVIKNTFKNCLLHPNIYFSPIKRGV